MDIITQFLAAMQGLMLVEVAVVVIGGCALAIAGAVRRNRPMLVGGMLVAVAPLALPWLSNRSYEGTVAARQAYVRALPTVPIPADYPRRLVIDGDVDAGLPAWLIAAGYVDEVDIGGDHLRGGVADPAACRAAALAIHDPDRPDSRARRAARPTVSVATCSRRASRPKGDGNALILRLGNRTTLFDRANARRRGAPRAVQLSVGRGGRETLAHYDEMPILATEASGTRLLGEQYGFPCAGFDVRQIVANLLDAARSPARAEMLRRRGARPYSRFDDCIASPSAGLGRDDP